MKVLLEFAEGLIKEGFFAPAQVYLVSLLALWKKDQPRVLALMDKLKTKRQKYLKKK